MSLTIKLRALESLLPQLSGVLHGSDYTSLCGRLLSISSNLAEGVSMGTAGSDISKVIAQLDQRFPAVTTPVRGIITEALDESPISADEVRSVAHEVRRNVRHILAVHQMKRAERESIWLGAPELWIFDRLAPAMRARATRIRDWCEERLEFMHSRGEARYYTAHGIGHSKRVLRLCADLLKPIYRHVPDSFSYFAMYVAAYCHDLGMLFREDEDPEDPALFEEIRKAHGKRVWEIMIGKKALGIPPSWQAMGFTSEAEAMLVANICAVHQRRSHNLLLSLPKSQALFLDGQSRTVPTLALAAILRLADALDCHEGRLPPPAYLKHRGIPLASLRQYVKHEIIESAMIDASGQIHIGMRIRYVYPDGVSLQDVVRNEIQEEVEVVRALLKTYGLRLPEAEFTLTEAMFLEEHPYLCSAGQSAKA